VRVGVIYPQTELPTDPATVRAYVAAVEKLGYRHIEIYDHVLGADPAVHTDWKGPYDVDTTFHEPFVFYGFLAALTRMELVTGIVIAPQRQTGLLAKQAAEVDILTEGNFRLGIGAGWNRVEYEALGQDFSTRGKRSGRSRTRARSTRSSEPGSLRCPCSGPSRSGSEDCRQPHTDGWGGSPTAGSRG
jgi:alkanesulfonate monooxygenase SsuD/methylene tetrahydromethanopterin reductase-like flavin-dependent oxidoreductase (luciferase family)